VSAAGDGGTRNAAEANPNPEVVAVTTRPALRLTVLVGENDMWHHRPVSAEIVHRASEAGLAGASVFRGCEGFGTTAVVHTARLLSLSEDLPVAVVIVDLEDRVRAFLPRVEELMAGRRAGAGGGLVTLEPVDVVLFGDGGATREDQVGDGAGARKHRSDHRIGDGGGPDRRSDHRIGDDGDGKRRSDHHTGTGTASDTSNEYSTPHDDRSGER
jgi:PII-like signaling protein